MGSSSSAAATAAAATGAAPVLAAVDQVKKKSAGAAVQSSGRIRPAARLRLAREDGAQRWSTRGHATTREKCLASATRYLAPTLLATIPDLPVISRSHYRDLRDV